VGVVTAGILLKADGNLLLTTLATAAGGLVATLLQFAVAPLTPLTLIALMLPLAGAVTTYHRTTSPPEIERPRVQIENWFPRFPWEPPRAQLFLWRGTFG
jgi:hypothetical protein